ncbi:uncharacterized protein LOC130791751 [Actinidia eriantha]|uniref:uncharacterized protein LOC130791751 n=1 Tax=Actinidia eriantha TaxID=165200 RepID=UPI002589C318|nr:uncharacterized protein LOC130791751 [Actinidia eriantha]XP_057509014.1 uncharacterized protein LOC130791751 [Actinidia eriantha]XP_057509016.1 uncharacterized protein LOC130791751 [Actinidia eriantha]XP_057509017.1 uncharacterized protein LOC130791751 [Actinidia eriantha]XP_057509018.1 uncharacterized protein LOC130791751 [Actinidia eriantha]XP_057509019.1 uncharacterized protein LOC130791751 [Actinidia eriantha]XP_057509020.1 uncharacterized protein LOC130791751 [Actinidia eriantha]XP_0
MHSPLSSRASQSSKFQDGLKLEKPTMSYADLHSEVTKKGVNHQKQQVERKATEKEELVKYMSNLPSYLEKGENLKEKAFNVGVLDWRQLEKWQHNRKPESYQSSRYSQSSSNSSSFFTTDESSTRSSRGHSCSPAHPRMHRSTLQSHLNASPKEGVKTSVENVEKSQDLKAASSNHVKGQQSIFRMYQSFSRNQSESKLKEGKRKDKEPQIIPEIETSSDLKTYEAASRSKGKTKIQDGESSNGLEELKDTCCDDHQNCHERFKTVRPRDDPQSSKSAISCPCDLESLNDQRSAEASRRSHSEGSLPKEIRSAGPYSDIPHSCPLPCEDERSSSLDAKSTEFSSEPSQPFSCSVIMSISPPRSKSVEKKSNIMPRNSSVIKYAEGSDVKKGTLETCKSRKPSPTCRLITGLGRIGRPSGSKDSSEHVAAKCETDKAVVFSRLEDPNNDKPSGRSQSSPLRRLLDPLLKPKAANSQHPSEKDPTSVDRTCKSSNGRVESSAVQSGKVKLDLTSCKTISVDDSHHKKHESSTLQALLRIVIKNGLPLFTFAVDNNSDILAATMRKANASSKNDNYWIYTFFTVHELKKKNGWINHGGKGKSRSYIPNAIAQMTVSDPRFSNLANHNSVDEVSIREFVLFALDLTKVEQRMSNLQTQTNDELAAIIVKVPKETSRSLNKYGKPSNYVYNPSAIDGFRENGSCVRSKDLSAMVILPGGVHGLASKGKPSPLIERWKSGGLCDCGGWDMGCRLSVLSNQTKLARRSSKTHNTADKFELFSQGEILEDTPVFSLSPFKEGIFSVEFNSSVSFLQAFSICIAVLNSREPYELSELSKLFEEKYSEESTVVVNDGIKASSQVKPEVPAIYASYPPLSPIGRV